MQKTIFLVITISILFFSVHSEAAGVKESRTWSSGNSLLLSKMSIMQSTQPADYTNNGDNIQSSRSNMRWDATFEEGVNMGWDATFEEGVNVELLSYSSTCTDIDSN